MMKHKIFLSLVAGSLLFVGCGGGGGSVNPGTENPDNGNPDNGNPDNGNPDNGNPDADAFDYTKHKFTYTGRFGGELGDDVITVESNGTWSVDDSIKPVLGSKSSELLTYQEAVDFCSNNNGVMPGPNDLLVFDFNSSVLTRSWAEGQFSVNVQQRYFEQEAATKKYVVQCLTSNSDTVDKKHSVEDHPDSKTVEDKTTGLTWSYFQKADANSTQYTFPMSDANESIGSMTAQEFCSQLGMELPTLAQLRSAVYLDGETLIPSDANLSKITVIWTKTPVPGAPGQYFAVYLTMNGGHKYEEGNASKTGSNAYHFVTCVSEN